jgi:DNA helicase HerA-like ATPase
MENLIGTVKGPGENPNEYVFITKDNEHTRIGEFVFYETEIKGCKQSIIGNITNRALLDHLPDPFFDDPNIKPAEIASLIGMQQQELYEVTVENIGYFDHSLKDFINPRIQPNPGDSVYLVPSEMLADAISMKKRDEEGSAYLGTLLIRDEAEVPVVLAAEEFTSTHLAILASTGSGKSYTAGVHIEELMAPQNRAAVLIVDPHNEYHTLADIQKAPEFTENSYRPKVKIFQPSSIKVRLSSLTEADIKYLLPEGASEKMHALLSQAFRSLKERLRAQNQSVNYSWEDLYDEVDKLKTDSNLSSIEGLKWRIQARFGRPNSIFSATEHIRLQELFEPGQCTVLQLFGIEKTEQQVIVATILRRVNQARMSTTRGLARTEDEYLPYPVFILLEEAHIFAPASKNAVSTDILKQILSEGRKFGIGIGLISQRPGKVDQDVLSQCMTQIIMRVVNPVDQATIAESIECVGRSLLNELPSLSKGQAIISGASLNLPVMCRIRKRITPHGGENPNSPAEWRKWFSEESIRRRKQNQAPYLGKGSSDPDEIVGGIPV